MSQTLLSHRGQDTLRHVTNSPDPIVTQIEYVHRLNYLDLPTATRHGIRFVITPTF